MGCVNLLRRTRGSRQRRIKRLGEPAQQLVKAVAEGLDLAGFRPVARQALLQTDTALLQRLRTEHAEQRLGAVHQLAKCGAVIGALAPFSWCGVCGHWWP